MSVDIDTAWLLEHATNADSCPFVFAAAVHPDGLDPLAALREAVQLVNGMSEVELTDGDEYAPTADRPSPSPRGPMSSVFFDGDPDLTIAWIRLLAKHLSKSGWLGRIEPLPWAQQVAPAASGGAPLTAVLALSGWWQRRPNGAAFPVWRQSPQPAEDLTRLACDWLAGCPGRHLFEVVGPAVEATPPELRDLIRAALADQEAKGFLLAQTVGSPEGQRAARFGSKGHVFLSARQPGVGIRHQLAAIAAAAIPWAGRCDHVYVAGAEADPEQARAERGREPVARYYKGLRWLDQEHLPDAFAWQIVTGRHLANAHDLSGWRIDEIAEDRYTLAHPDPEAWFLPHPENDDWTRVDSDVLEQARADFGDLILKEPVPRQT